MDIDEISPECISAESIGLSLPKWCRLMAMLVGRGYIKGVEVWNSFDLLNDAPVLLMHYV